MQRLWLEVNVTNARKCIKMFQKIIFKNTELKLSAIFIVAKYFQRCQWTRSNNLNYVFSTIFHSTFAYIYKYSLHVTTKFIVILKQNQQNYTQILHISSIKCHQQNSSVTWCYISDVFAIWDQWSIFLKKCEPISLVN